MTDQEHLERAYRRLLAWYPREFRRENGPEILAVLLADARDGQRRPGLAQSADLIRSGLWMRLRPSVPRSAPTVRAAVRLMYAGAAVAAVNLILVLAVTADAKVYHAVLGHRLTAAQVRQLNLTTLGITELIVLALIPVALWLWMARKNGQGRNWARGLSKGLFVLSAQHPVFGALATEHPVFGLLGTQGIREGLVPVVFGPIIPVLTWLAGFAAVLLLELRASRAFFKPGSAQALHQARMAEPGRLRSFRLPGYMQALRQAQMADLARTRPPRARWVRQV
jgi:hypothetical protein